MALKYTVFPEKTILKWNKELVELHKRVIKTYLASKGVTHRYTLTMAFPNKTYESQNEDLGKTLSAHIIIANEGESTFSNLTIIDDNKRHNTIFNETSLIGIAAYKAFDSNKTNEIRNVSFKSKELTTLNNTSEIKNSEDDYLKVSYPYSPYPLVSSIVLLA